MQITIKKNGRMQGTIGWLAKKLEKGELFLEEGNLKSNGNHGLWLKDTTNNFAQFLAAFNQYGVKGHDCVDIKYDIANEYEDREQCWTDAAWKVLMEIAQEWCDEMNEIIDSEEEPSIKIVRVEMI